MGLCSQARKLARKMGHSMSHNERRVEDGVEYDWMMCVHCTAIAVVRKGEEPQGSAITERCTDQHEREQSGQSMPNVS